MISVTERKKRKEKDGRIASKKRLFQNFGAVFCVILAVLGVCLVVFRDQLDEEARTMYLFIGFLQTVMSLIALLMGVLLPEEGKELTGRAKKIMKVIAALAMLGGKGTSGVAAYNMLNGTVILQRFWEPAWFLAWLLLEGMILWFYPAGGALGIMVALSIALLIALIGTSVGWSIMYRKETDTLKWYLIVGPSLFILLLFGIVFLVTFINDVRREPALTEKLDDARTEIERALEDYEDGSYSEEAIDTSRMTMDDIIGMLKNDVGGDVYYCWVPGDDDIISVTAWSDESDEVYVYQFTKSDDTYVLNMGFISTSLTKDDVEGKEHGVIPAVIPDE